MTPPAAASRRNQAARLLRELRDDPRRRLHSEASVRVTQRLITELEATRRKVCPYPGPTCDCKYGAFPGGEPRFQPKRLGDEHNGCPELREMIRALQADIEPA